MTLKNKKLFFAMKYKELLFFQMTLNKKSEFFPVINVVFLNVFVN